MSLFGSLGGSLISAGASLLGGKMARKSAEEQQEENLENQREFAQQGIRWRVADAKAAGLHPLFALQGGGAAYAPSPIIIDPMAEAIRSMGQAFGSGWKVAERTQRDGSARQVPDAELVGMGEVQPSQFSDLGSEMSWDWAFPNAGAYQVKPAQIVASGSSGAVTAGPPSPGYTPYNLDGLQMDMPSQALSEPLESMGEGFIAGALTIQHNIDKYGPGWLYDFGRKLFVVRQVLDAHQWARDATSGFLQALDAAVDKGKGPSVSGKIRGAAQNRPDEGHRYYDFKRARWINR